MSASEEKTEEPSDLKLLNARKNGDVAVSHHLTESLVFLAACTGIYFSGDLIFLRADMLFAAALDTSRVGASDEGLAAAAIIMIYAALHVVVPLLVLVFIVSLLAGLIQTRGMLSIEPMKFKLDRLNPMEAIKIIFSTRQFGVLLHMLLAIAFLGWVVVATSVFFWEPMIYSMYNDERIQRGIFVGALMHLFFNASLVYLVLGFIDYAQQFFEYRKRNRMSKTDRRLENKENYGNPEIKAEVRARWIELQERQPGLGVAGASVVITNPTHFAVALYYSEGDADLPIVIAKGKDETALSMRAEAVRFSVPIMENPPLARALYSSVNLWGYIGEDHIEAVAEVFRWVRRVNRSTVSDDVEN